MNEYKIIVVDIEEKGESRTFNVTAEDIETLTSNLEETANYGGHVELELVDGTILECDQHSEHGYNANLYASREAFDNGEDPTGGGLCTGTLSDAIEMAITNRVITQKDKEINLVNCGACGGVFGHIPEVLYLTCPYCKFCSDRCHFPDLYTDKSSTIKLK